jgi:hypothetical protein
VELSLSFELLGAAFGAESPRLASEFHTSQFAKKKVSKLLSARDPGSKLWMCSGGLRSGLNRTYNRNFRFFGSFGSGFTAHFGAA